MEGILKGQKIPSFEGKKDKFPQWSFTFLSICMIAGCKDVLTLDTVVVPAEDEDLDPADPLNTLPIARRKANCTAYALLTITIKDATGFQAIRNGKTTDLPNGSARLAWKNLIRIYQPKSTTQKYDLEQKFNDCKLEKETKNPDEWFTELEHIRVLLQEDHAVTTFTDAKLIQHIIYNMKPKCYDTIVFTLKRDLEYNNAINPLDLERVKDEIRQVYGQQAKVKTPETALAAGKFGKKFKGECRICGAKGHKASDCWDSEKNKSKRPAYYKNPEERKKAAETANPTATANATTGERPKLFCTYCKKDNHTEDRCFKKQRDNGITPTYPTSNASVATTAVALICYNTCMLTGNIDGNTNSNTFIADSGASAHMVHSKHLLSNFKEELGKVKIGDGAEVDSLGTGTLNGYHMNKDGKQINVSLDDVLLVPSLWVNLFSITRATSKPNCKVVCEDNLITVDTNSEQIHFNKSLPHGEGKIMATELFTHTECASLVLQKTTYADLHCKLGHPHKQAVIETAKHYGIKLMTQTEEPVCAECALSKIRVKNLGYNEENEATTKGERMAIDISSIKSKSYGGAKFWLLVQDEFTEFIWSFFLSGKDETSETMIQFLKIFQKQHSLKVQNIRLDNSGENRAFKENAEKENLLNINWEFTAANTPQQNGKIERKFATLWGKVRAILNSAKLPWSLRYKLWAQCANLSTQLENILISKYMTSSPYEKMHNKEPKWLDNLHTFGEIAVVHDGTKIKSKLADKGLLAMFVGYPDNHAGEVCLFLNLTTKRLIQSRSAIFLHKTYSDWYKLKQELISHVPAPTIEDDTNENVPLEQDVLQIQQDYDDEPFHNLVDDLPDDDEYDYTESTISNKGIRELMSLQTYYNPDPLQYVDTIQHAAVLATFNNPPEVALNATIYDGNPDPKTYYEATTSLDWPNWWGAICTEFDNMHSKQVWTIIPRSSIPANRKIIGNRWVFAQKDDGRFRARTVAKGFTQIPGKDFQENHSPVVNDTTFHTILVLKILLKLEAGQFDIETAFLYGELEEKLWMEIPEGYIKYIQDLRTNGKQNETPMANGTQIADISEKTHCLELKKAIYGLVQAARQWWKKFKQVILDMGYKPSLADPCLFYKDGNPKSFIIIYVDDGGIFSDDKTIKEVINALSKTFNVKYLGKLENFIGCKLIENEARDTIWIHQPKLFKHLEQAFGKLVEDVREYKTPAAPKTTIVRPQPGDPLISVEKQKMYRSGVGMLLYLVKHSRPDISNATRELSKVGDGATEAHWKQLLRAIKYTISTKNKALKMQPKMKKNMFYLEGISDSSFGEDKDTRISVYGYVVYFCGAPVATKSKLGRSVTLSSTEAEHFAVSEVAKEILFIKQLLETIGIEVELPIIVRVDNVGAIFLGNNFSVGQRTKHIDIRTHFVRKYIEDDILKLVFIRSEDNDADIFTKNTTEDLYVKHSNKMVEELAVT
jgi:transposase InsO family protein